LIVRDISPGWLWVSVRKAGQHFEGWISAAEAATLDDAIARAGQAVQSNTSDAMARLQRGKLYAAKGEHQKAIADFTEALRLDANLVEAYCQRAEAWLLVGEAESSLDDCDKAIQLNPQSGEAYRHRGDAYLADGSLEQALADYDRAIQLDPTSPAAVNGRAVVWLHRGEVDKAIAESTKAIEIDPSFVPAYLSRAGAWLAKGEPEKAVRDYQAALTLDPKNVVALHGLATCSHKQGNLDEAIQLYSRAIQAAPRYASAYANRADCHYRKGDLDQALADYNEAIRLDASPADAYLGRASVLRALGEAGRAQVDLARAKYLEVLGSGSRGVATQVVAVPEGELASRLSTALERQEFVSIELAPLVFGPIQVRVQEYSFEDRFIRQQPGCEWFSTVLSPQAWQNVQALLVQHADRLLDCKDWAAAEEPAAAADLVPPRWTALLFHKPRPHTLSIAPNLQVVLSPKAQQHLIVTAVSTYPASRSVLIVGEPHWNLQQHWSLLQGLEILFADNPSLLADKRTVFLSEGLPNGEQLSVAPLVRADAKPSDRQIRYVLGSFLIPGYVAYEWKHQRGIPILGVEDPVLYGVCARAWLESNSHTADLGRYASLLSYAVGARNHSVAETLASQLPRYDCPILFIGSGHLGDGWTELGLFSATSLSSTGGTSAANCGRFADLVQSGELERLKEAGSRGLLELIRDRKIGYYCLEARADPLPNASAQQRSAERYAALLKAQLGGNADAYIRNYAAGCTSVSVRPSAELATSVVYFAQLGGNDDGNKDDGGEGATEGSEASTSSASERLASTLDKVRDALSKLLEWLGPDPEVKRNDDKSFVVLSKDGKRKFRIDYRPNPHGHLEELQPNGKWRDATETHRIFPKS